MNEFSALIMKIGGERASRVSEKYSEEHGPLKIGKIVSLASVKLHSFFLFHTVLVAVNETTPTDSAINSALSAAFFEANGNLCRSISFPTLELKQKTIMKIVKTFTGIITRQQTC